ncbi:hypothetical protein V6M85_05660 [Sulfolobus tengchongensis]|uniref:Uncharacterized protein n=1 Tax=Sulfolobus tengchongensis TaxID=207809 RepID=A0AAX4L4H0_9CREN
MRKGLSNSVTVMIVLIASVILTVILISIVFNYLGYFSGTTGEIRQIGTALITQNGELNVTIMNTFRDAQIVEVMYNNTLYKVNLQLAVGQQTYTINTGFKFPSGVQSVTVILVVVTPQNTIYLPVTAQVVSG